MHDYVGARLQKERKWTRNAVCLIVIRCEFSFFRSGLAEDGNPTIVN